MVLWRLTLAGDNQVSALPAQSGFCLKLELVLVTFKILLSLNLGLPTQVLLLQHCSGTWLPATTCSGLWHLWAWARLFSWPM
mgnify:CR=1 FL=1